MTQTAEHYSQLIGKVADSAFILLNDFDQGKANEDHQEFQFIHSQFSLLTKDINLGKVFDSVLRPTRIDDDSRELKSPSHLPDLRGHQRIKLFTG